MHGVNPPLGQDQRQQRKLVKKMNEKIKETDLSAAIKRAVQAIADVMVCFMRELNRDCDSAMELLSQHMKEGNLDEKNNRNHG